VIGLSTASTSREQPPAPSLHDPISFRSNAERPSFAAAPSGFHPSSLLCRLYSQSAALNRGRGHGTFGVNARARVLGVLLRFRLPRTPRAASPGARAFNGENTASRENRFRRGFAQTGRGFSGPEQTVSKTSDTISIWHNQNNGAFTLQFSVAITAVSETHSYVLLPKFRAGSSPASM